LLKSNASAQRYP